MIKEAKYIGGLLQTLNTESVIFGGETFLTVLLTNYTIELNKIDKTNYRINILNKDHKLIYTTKTTMPLERLKFYFLSRN